MFEYQIIVEFNGVRVLRTEWHVGKTEARDMAWLLASKLGDAYRISVRERQEPFTSIPWEEFGMADA